MPVVPVHEFKTNLARLLASADAGVGETIACGQMRVAKRVPITATPDRARPTVGKMISPPFEGPALALAPLAPDGLKHWGL